MIEPVFFENRFVIHPIHHAIAKTTMRRRMRVAMGAQSGKPSAFDQSIARALTSPFSLSLIMLSIRAR